MAQFASDSFTGTDGTTLQVYNPAWTKHPSYSDNIVLDTNRARLFQTGASSAYYHSATPASADYSVSIDVYVKAYSPNLNLVGVIGRASTSVNTFYHAWHSISQGWQLFRFNSGTVTQLGTTISHTLTVGSTYNLKLDMVGDVIRLLVDSVEIISEVDTSPLLSAGKAGIRAYHNIPSEPTNTNGLHIDNFSADEAGGGTSYGFVNVSGSWKTVSGVHMNVGGTWKSGQLYSKVSGVWKPLS